MREKSLYVIDENYKIIYMNKNLRLLYPEAKEGLACYELMTGGNRPCNNCPLKSQRGSTRVFNPKRGLYLISEAVECEWNGKENCYAVSFSPDLSEGKISAQLENSEFGGASIAAHVSQFKRVYPGSGVILQKLESGLPVYYANNTFLRMLGYESFEDFISCGELIDSHIHKDDVADSMGLFSGDVYAGMQYAATYRIKRKDGAYFWVVDKGEILKDDKGEKVVISVINDISKMIDLKWDIEKENEELKKQNTILRFLYDKQPGGYHRCELKPGYPIVDMSPRFCEMLGYTEVEIREEFGGLFINLVYPDDRNVFDAHDDARAEGQDTFETTYRMLHKTKGYIWVKDVSQYYEYENEEFIQCTILDITEETELENLINLQSKLIESEAEKQKQNEENMHQLKLINALSREFRNVFLLNLANGSLTPVYLSEEEDSERSKTVNSVIGSEFEKGIGSYVDKFVYHDDAEMIKNTLTVSGIKERLSTKRSFITNYRARYGETFRYFQIKCVRIGEEQGNFENVIVGFRNVDEQTRRDLEQRQLLSDALKEAQYASSAKTDFLNNISHDIRTPINAIIGYTDLSKRYVKDTERALDYLGKITVSSNHLLSLINGVLDMSRIESGKMKLDERNENIAELMQGISDIIKADVEAKRIKFTTDISSITGKIVVCDRLRVNQILLNLLSNAIKFTPNGGDISLVVKEIGIPAEGYMRYSFTVKDSGIGMSDDFIGKIFEPFSRERTSTISRVQGTGLGMAITKSIVDLLGGTITVKSEKGKGSEFTVLLTFAVASGVPSNEIGNEADKSLESVDFSGKRLLLVEDNDLNREIFTVVLSEAGFEVDSVENGKEAVDKISESVGDCYNLILMDIQMPIMNGYEATNAIRRMNDKDKASIPIIAMTANAFEEDKAASLSAGMNDHIGKPVSTPKLLDAIKKHIL